MIKTKNLTQTYGNFNALSSVSVSLRSGVITAILGENGSGKSTLLNQIGRLRIPTIGSIHLNEVDIQGIPSMTFAKMVSVLKQNNHHNLNLTAQDLVAFGRYPHSPHRLNQNDEKIIKDCMTYMGCLELSDHSIQTLSGGQLQRVYIAMILAQDTDLILLDEPLNNLDLKHSHEFMTCMKRLVEERNKTIVMIMHDVNMVYRYCDDVLCLKSGTCIASGPVDTTLTKSVLYDLYQLNFSITTHNSIKVCCVE